jgi:hypothetical protein
MYETEIKEHLLTGQGYQRGLKRAYGGTRAENEFKQ